MLVLASASPRRRDLLRAAGIEFEVQAVDIRETPHLNENPLLFARRMAREKALSVFASRSKDYVLGADTIVVVDREILGKPRDEEDALRMLRLLCGRSHEVITAVCIAGPGTPPDERESRTVVSMDVVPVDALRNYVATKEPMDKAGAYAIQGIASRWITEIAGDYSNVVGLPVPLVWKMLKQRGLV